MNPILSLHTWISLPQEIRERIRSIFSIPRSAFVSVLDQKLESDGTTSEDIKVLTVEKMQTYLNDVETTDFNILFHKVVERVNDEINKKDDIITTETIPPTEPTEPATEVYTVTSSKTPKNAKKK